MMVVIIVSGRGAAVRGVAAVKVAVPLAVEAWACPLAFASMQREQMLLRHGPAHVTHHAR